MRILVVLVVFSVTLWSCQKVLDPVQSKAFGKTPDYAWVLPEVEVRQITINLTDANWQKIQRDMEYRTIRKFGSATTLPGTVAPQGVGSLDAVPGDPIYVEAKISQGNNNWEKVGFRLKGNASLSATWRSGVYKLPFKLQFDEFEDIYPATKNQRFYGFKELSFAPSFGDNTFLKEKLLTDLFRKAGVLACKIAYYKVYIDFGSGVKYCGIYQAVESVAEHLVENQTGDKVGNVYKPESSFETFVLSEFEKQNNKKLADFTDVKTLITTLNSPQRVNDKDGWKKELEAIFDVKGFLNYLAVNNSVGNWDSYGQLKHNYFLASRNGILNWIPYDMNLSFQMKGGLNRTALTMEMDEVTRKWPLIRFIMDDPAYFAYYKSAVKNFLEYHFTTSKMSEYLNKHKAILAPNFTASEIEKPPYTYLQSPNDFSQAYISLEKYINERILAVSNFVNENQKNNKLKL